MDPYKVLEIDNDASDTEIKKAYHKLARKYHPDRNKNDKQSEEKFKEVNEAYFMLMNGGSSNQAFGNDGAFPDIDSIFGKFRGMDFTKISQKLFNEAKLFQKFFSEKHPDPNGCEAEKPTMDDIVINARIDIKDIYYNLEKKFSIPRKVKCRDCMGMGTITNNIPCSECNGERYIDREVALKIEPAKNHHVFFKRGDEHISKYTGNVVVNVIPRNLEEGFVKIWCDTKDEIINPLYIDIINSYDLLIQIERERIPRDTKQFKIKILEQSYIKIDVPINIRRVKIESLGLINPYKFIRGDVFIQII